MRGACTTHRQRIPPISNGIVSVNSVVGKAELQAGKRWISCSLCYFTMRCERVLHVHTDKEFILSQWSVTVNSAVGKAELLNQYYSYSYSSCFSCLPPNLHVSSLFALPLLMCRIWTSSVVMLL